MRIPSYPPPHARAKSAPLSHRTRTQREQQTRSTDLTFSGDKDD